MGEGAQLPRLPGQATTSHPVRYFTGPRRSRSRHALQLIRTVRTFARTFSSLWHRNDSQTASQFPQRWLVHWGSSWSPSCPTTDPQNVVCPSRYGSRGTAFYLLRADPAHAVGTKLFNLCATSGRKHAHRQRCERVAPVTGAPAVRTCPAQVQRAVAVAEGVSLPTLSG